MHCCVTSPPYFGLRDYGVAGQIGLEESPAAFVAELVDVFREVRRVLRPDGTFWMNLGDSYAGGGRGGNPTRASSTLEGSNVSQEASMVSRAMVQSRRRDNEMIPRTDVRQPGLKAKDLMGMPWRVAFALQADGWYLRQDIIWSKPNPMPESVQDRCTKAHEYLFLLSKSATYYFDADSIREDRSSDEDAVEFRGGSYIAGEIDNATMGKRKVVGNKRVKVPGGWDRGAGGHGTIHRDGRTSAEYQDAPVRAGRNKRSVWTVATQGFKEAHFATFPPALIEPCILAGCPAAGTVLDPFGGAGTTGMVADRLQRDAILIELNPEYAAIAGRRLDADAGMFANA